MQLQEYSMRFLHISSFFTGIPQMFNFHLLILLIHLCSIHVCLSEYVYILYLYASMILTNLFSFHPNDKNY